MVDIDWEIKYILGARIFGFEVYSVFILAENINVLIFKEGMTSNESA